MSEKSLRNQANHGFLAWAEDPRGRKGALPLERMRKRWRAGHSGVYSFVAGQAKWKSRVNRNITKIENRKFYVNRTITNPSYSICLALSM